jgi:UDP-hydrolysing UDP-N-acetyl-D-glucosamine 2-epimerase
VTRSVVFVTGTRADFGLWVPVLRAAAAHPDLEPSLLATAMHLDSRFGSTIEEVRSLGVPVLAEVACTPEGDSAADMAGSLGRGIEGMAAVLDSAAPDWLMVLGDRGEQLAAAIAGIHLGIAIGHVAGGDRTLGAVDDAMRDMITRAAALHFVAEEGARQRLLHLGEEDARIRVVGSPGLDDLRMLAENGDPAAARAAVGLPPAASYLLIAMHPETRGGRDPAQDMDAVLSATAATGLERVAVYPNADAGGRAMIARLEREPGMRLARSLPRPQFAVLLAGAAAMVGNSSAGLIEAPLLRVPAVNVAQRQAGRLRGDNVIDVEPDAGGIEAGLRRALRPEFRDRLSGRSPYGDGHAAEQIAGMLAAEPITPGLIHKLGAGEGDA